MLPKKNCDDHLSKTVKGTFKSHSKSQSQSKRQPESQSQQQSQPKSQPGSQPQSQVLRTETGSCKKSQPESQLERQPESQVPRTETRHPKVLRTLITDLLGRICSYYMGLCKLRCIFDCYRTLFFYLARTQPALGFQKSGHRFLLVFVFKLVLV